MNNKELIPTTFIENNGTAKISAPTDRKIYITAITNSKGSATTLTFADDTNLEVLELPTNASLSFNSPIRCSSFTPAHAAISVAYYTK